MTIKIEKKIKSWEIAKEKLPETTEETRICERDEITTGNTYKIARPSKEALYVTLNNNADGRVVEVFFNTKDSEVQSWLSTLSRMLSAIFRRERDLSFVVQELKAISEHNGGWFGKVFNHQKPRFIKSLPDAIGDVLEYHLNKDVIVAEVDTPVATIPRDSQYPAEATLCKECNEMAVVKLDGCATCLNCGNAKCG